MFHPLTFRPQSFAIASHNSMWSPVHVSIIPKRFFFILWKLFKKCRASREREDEWDALQMLFSLDFPSYSEANGQWSLLFSRLPKKFASKAFLATKKAAKSTGSSLFCCSSVTSQLQTPTRHLYVVWNPSSVWILFSSSDSDRSRDSELSLGMVLYSTES